MFQVLVSYGSDYGGPARLDSSFARVLGGPSDDTIETRGGGWLFGGPGNDIIRAVSDLPRDHPIRMYGEGGDDNLSSGERADHLDGGKGNHVINGAGGGDLIFGGTDADIISGEGGDDKDLLRARWLAIHTCRSIETNRSNTDYCDDQNVADCS